MQLKNWKLSEEEFRHMSKLVNAFFKNLEMEDGIYGNLVWTLNRKRPLGSKSLYEDILLIIGYKDEEIWEDKDNLELKPALEDYAEKLYINLGGFIKARWNELTHDARNG